MHLILIGSKRKFWPIYIDPENPPPTLFALDSDDEEGESNPLPSRHREKKAASRKQQTVGADDKRQRKVRERALSDSSRRSSESSKSSTKKPRVLEPAGSGSNRSAAAPPPSQRALAGKSRDNTNRVRRSASPHSMMNDDNDYELGQTPSREVVQASAGKLVTIREALLLFRTELNKESLEELARKLEVEDVFSLDDLRAVCEKVGEVVMDERLKLTLGRQAYLEKLKELAKKK